MSVATAGGQLYAQLAELLAPKESLEDTKSLVLLEPAGKDVAAVGAGGPAADEALADLANTIPAAAPTFLDTGAVYDDIWGFVLQSLAATGPDDDPVRVTLATLVNDNRADLDLMARARADGPGDVYHPVLAEPRDWLSEAGWSSASFRIGGEAPDPPPSPPPSIFIPDEIPELEWRLIEPIPEPEPLPVEPLIPPIWIDPPFDRLITPIVLRSDQPDRPDVSVIEPQPGANRTTSRALLPALKPLALQPNAVAALGRVLANDAVELDEGTRWSDVWAASRIIDVTGKVAEANPTPSGFELSFDYRVVGIKRRWLRAHLCRLSGWRIPGLDANGLSTGAPVGNRGLMPLLTTRMLVVRNLVVKAQWSDADRARAASAKTLSLGPFTVTGADGFDGTELTRPAPQVAAWLATVIPACPPQ